MRDGLIYKTTVDDRSVVKRVIDNLSKRKKRSCLIAGNQLLSSSDIIKNLIAENRVDGDRYALISGIKIRKERTASEIKDLFSIDDQQSEYWEFVFNCERRKFFLNTSKKILRRIYDILNDLNEKAGPMDDYERGLFERINKLQDMCGDSKGFVDNLITCYHAHSNLKNDVTLNHPKEKIQSFATDLVHSFIDLDVHYLEGGPNFGADDIIQEFFQNINKDLKSHRYLSVILSGRSFAFRINMKPLDKSEIAFIRAFADL